MPVYWPLVATTPSARRAAARLREIEIPNASHARPYLIIPDNLVDMQRLSITNDDFIDNQQAWIAIYLVADLIGD